MFLLASFIAVIVTLVSFSGFGPIRPASASMIGLQIVNFILIGALAFYVIRDFYALSKQSETSTRAQGSGKLARQFAMSFGFAAVMPAILVALFLGTSLNRGIENWFSERIQSIVETSADVARSGFVPRLRRSDALPGNRDHGPGMRPGRCRTPFLSLHWLSASTWL